MAGYAATARITHAAPHRVAHPVPDEAAQIDVVELQEPVVEELTGYPPFSLLTDCWDDVREIWRQSMDVLRDPRIY